jgi:hypothetical protein
MGDKSFKRLYGKELISAHIEKCVLKNNNNFNAGLKLYKQELNTLARFVRNPFMHRTFEISEDHFNRIFYRQCYVFCLMEQAFKKLLD